MLELHSGVKEAWVNKGIALANLAKYKEAIKCYEEAFLIDPDFEEVQFYKLLSLRNLKKSSEK